MNLNRGGRRLSAGPPASSGISWKHVNGRSPNYYLPETTGAGCAFFDFDNDGWMDIYLVNSGRCDFFDPHPPLRNALYKNNRDGTFSDVTDIAGLQGGDYGMVWRSAITTDPHLLAIAEIEVNLGDQTNARSHLEALRKEATDRGFGLIAIKAAGDLKNLPSSNPNRD